MHSSLFLLRGLGAQDWRRRSSGGVCAGMGLKLVQGGMSLQIKGVLGKQRCCLKRELEHHQTMVPTGELQPHVGVAVWVSSGTASFTARRPRGDNRADTAASSLASARSSLVAWDNVIAGTRTEIRWHRSCCGFSCGVGHTNSLGCVWFVMNKVSLSQVKLGVLG